MGEEKTFCILCGKEIDDECGELCPTCLELLKHKYPDKESFKRRLEWLRRIFRKEKESGE